jgi:hypothetical protein
MARRGIRPALGVFEAQSNRSALTRSGDTQGTDRAYAAYIESIRLSTTAFAVEMLCALDGNRTAGHDSHGVRIAAASGAGSDSVAGCCYADVNSDTATRDHGGCRAMSNDETKPRPVQAPDHLVRLG